MDTEGAVEAPGTPQPEPFALVPEPEPTGHPDVDAALERLRELPERPTGTHPELYDGIHQRLQEALAQIDRQDAGSQSTGN
ncbi:MAG TPA: hypothetical protein VFU65_01250 [Actinocrinis sp.]|nr:hypothetical protein [Actinocrinis sp.]